MKKILGLLILSLSLTGCSHLLGGEPNRREKPPTQEEVNQFLEDTLGVEGAELIAAYNVLEGETPPDDREYYGVDALYVFEHKDRGITFEVRSEYDYDGMFGTGYHYSWTSNYDRVAIQDYLEQNPLPRGVVYDINRGRNSRYTFLDGHEPMIHFECADKDEFEEYADAVEDWLTDWMYYERSFLTNERTMNVRVTFKQPPSEGYENGMSGDVILGGSRGLTKLETFSTNIRIEYENRRKFDKTEKGRDK